MCMLAIRMSSLEKGLFKSYARFLIGFFVFLLFSCEGSFYILDTNSLSEIGKYFSPVCRLSFPFLEKVC